MVNVIIFGQTGAGKSSLINMLADSALADVTSETYGGTSSNQSFQITMPSSTRSPATYTFWDTPGLNEGEFGTVEAQQAMANLFRLAKYSSINLVVYCVRGHRFPEAIRVNYDLFWRIICGGKVPIVLVVTGLEQERDMDDWWSRNRKTIEQMGMKFSGYACVTTTKGRNEVYEKVYQQSKRKIWELVQKHTAQNPWTMPNDQSGSIWNLVEQYKEKEKTGGRGFWEWLKEIFKKQ